MKRSVFLFFVAAAIVTAQSATEVEITAEPHHHLTLENKSVRVFNVQVDPGTETLTHWHRHDYVSVTLGDIEITNGVKDKPPVNAKLPDGDVRFVPATFAHFVRDVSDHPFRNVTIEFLEDETLRKSAAKWDEDRGLDVLANGTRQVLFVKDGVRASEIELQPGGTVPKHHHAAPYLVVAVCDLKLRSDIEGKQPVTSEWRAGESRWLEGNSTHSVTNTGAKAAKFVILEFP